MGIGGLNGYDLSILPLRPRDSHGPQPPLRPDAPLAIIGLGYVGLPLAVEFGKHRLREDVGVEVLCLPLSPGPFDALILAVTHRYLIEMGAVALRALGKAKCVLYNVKDVLPAEQVDGRL